MDEITYDEMDDLIENHFSLFWSKTQIANCFKNGMNKKQTIQYMYELAEFTTDVLEELHTREGHAKEIISK